MKSIVFAALISIGVNAFAQQPGTQAPAISGQTIDGMPMRLQDLKGKIVLLDFWESKCKPCKEKFSFLNKLQERLKFRGFRVLAINVDDDPENMYAFLKKQAQPAKFPIVSDSRNGVPEDYLVQDMPTAVLIDKSGVIRYRQTGFDEAEKEKLVSEIAALLK